MSASDQKYDKDRYDWEGFYVEVVRLAYRPRGMSLNAETLQDYMRHWCLLTWRRCPTEDLLREKLQPVVLGLGGSGGGGEPLRKKDPGFSFA